MASTALPAYLAVLAAFLCLAPGSFWAAADTPEYSMSMGLVSGSVSFDGDSQTDIKLKMFYKGNHPPGASGDWVMSAYGSATDNPNKKDLIQVTQILSDADSHEGNNVDFTSNEVVLTGMNGCSGDNYACYIIKKGSHQWSSKCFNFSPPCPVDK